MKIFHRIVLNLTEDATRCSQLRKLGVDVKEEFTVVLIEESNPTWKKLKLLLKEWNITPSVETEFTMKELHNAPYLKVDPSWHWDYPKPDGENEYLELTYDLSHYSEKSGIGAVQKAPFRVKGEPKWGKRQILQLHWVFDTYFVLPGVWESVFKPFGIEAMPVLHHKTGKTLETIVQLVPQGIATSDLILDGYPFEICPETGIKKYEPIMRGYFPSLKRPCSMHYFHSREYFGSGGAADKAALVSAELFKAIEAKKLRGVSFMPMAQ